MGRHDHTAARDELRAMQRRNWKVAMLALAVGVVTLPLPAGILYLPAGAIAIAALFLLVAYRARAAERCLEGPCVEVFAVGWARAPDGCNYALFDSGADPSTDKPRWVLRLPRVRPLSSTRARLCGEPRPTLLGGRALIGRDGTLLAVGRIVDDATAQRRWERRHDKSPTWVYNPSGNRPPKF